MTTPYAPVWDDSAAPGGYVCNLCRTPVESEPCAQHSPAGQLRAAATKLREAPTGPARSSSDMFNRAAVRIGDESIGGCADCGVDAEIDTPELAALLAGLLNAREPLAAWLDAVADEITDYGVTVSENDEGGLYVLRGVVVRDWTAALKTARTILGGAQ